MTPTMTGTLFPSDDNRDLYRRDDPWTSRASAEQVKRDIKGIHLAILARYVHHGPHTDDQMALWAVDENLCARHEQARRIIRTLRDHNLIRPELQPGSATEVATAVNASGRSAILYNVNSHGARLVLDPASRKVIS